MKRLLLIISILFFLPAAEAAHLDLAWRPNQEQDIAGYQIYYGTSSGEYTHSEDAGNVTAYRLKGLLDGVTYYIALTAYDTEGQESALSQEASGLGVAEENSGPPPEVKDEDG